MFLKIDNMGRPSTTVVIHEHYNELAHRFYEHQLKVGYTPNSSRTHWHRIREFLHYAETQVSTDITVITTENILQFYRYQQERPSKKDGKPLSQQTLLDYLRIIKAFYTMLQHIAQVAVNPVNTIRIQYQKTESPRTALTQAQIKELYKHTHTLQERAILSLAYGCGLRVSELVGCNIEDVRFREQLLIVPRGKGNKSRTVPMSKTVARDLSNYFFKERLQQTSRDTKTPAGAGQAFILHGKGGRMKKYTYNTILQKLIARTGNEEIKAKQISIHNLRHSIATHLIEQGVPLEKVQEFLGHAHLDTTEVYTHISQLQLKELVG